MRPLSQLVNAISGVVEWDAASGGIELHHVTADSHQAGAGSIFVAVRGGKHDGAAFIPQVVAQGCRVVVAERSAPLPEMPQAPCVLRVGSARRALSELAAALFVPQPEYIAAVTGTDGKTSTAEFFRQLMVLQGRKAASVGTLGVIGADDALVMPALNTTPDPVQLHQALQQLASGGYSHVGMEASSHGLDQYRLHGVKVVAAAFTYLGRDHLDYHDTVEAYFAAKKKLFSEVLAADGLAVLNQDDESFAALESLCRARNLRIIGYGRQGHHLRIATQAPTALGQEVTLDMMGQAHALALPLVGDFQVMNMLAALGLGLGCGGDVQVMAALLPKLKGIPGRLERAATLENGAAVYVDYAHTPMALAKVLKVLRAHTSARLHVVFGCGGERDAGKRPEMGRIAAELADVVTVTDDNPRGEDANAIRKAIMLACKGAKEVAERRQAIYGAVRSLQAGDILVLAGKGHEKTQIIAGKEFAFDDVAVAREAVKEIDGAVDRQ